MENKNFYYDTEFLEGTQKKSLLGIPYSNTKNTIDLISIGIVSDDNREYYAISKDFNLKEAWNRYDLKKEYPDNTDNGSYSRKVYWIRENVLRPIFDELSYIDYPDTKVLGMTFKSLKYLIKKYGKTNKQIAFEILQFTLDGDCKCFDNWLGFSEDYFKALMESKTPNINLYGYYSAYDHVALSWLFGKMIDLPKSFPMYTRDLKQILDEKSIEYFNREDAEHYSKETLEEKLRLIKNFKSYPKQTNEHSSIHDAHWNKKLHNFIKSL